LKLPTGGRVAVHADEASDNWAVINMKSFIY